MHLADVVHAQHPGTARDAVTDRRERAGEALSGAAPVSAPTKSLREAESRIGRPSVASSPSRRSSAIVCAGSLPMSGPGHRMIWSSPTPSAPASSIRSARKPLDVLDHVSVARTIELLLRPRQRVGDHERGAGLSADFRDLGLDQAARVVDHCGA